MKFFSGFCLNNEIDLFKEFLIPSDFTVAGFSKGAIEAFNYALGSKRRIDRLQLLSPAFFQNKNDKFKRLQLIHFKKDKQKYIENFLKNVAYPSKIDMQNFLNECDIRDLEFLLEYRWIKNDLKNLTNRGVLIEVYLGEKDKIVDSKAASEFFKDFATVYFIKKAGHILKGE